MSNDLLRSETLTNHYRAYNTTAPEMTQRQSRKFGDKSSKLDLMREDYQRRLLKEKEEKLIKIYTDSQRKAMAKLAKTGQNDVQFYHNNISDNTSVRSFFNERRQMEANGVTMPPIQNHYYLTRGTPSSEKFSNNPGSGNSIKTRQVNFVDERNRPLPPIQKSQFMQEDAINNEAPVVQKESRKIVSEGDYNYMYGNSSFDTRKLLPSANVNITENENNYRPVDSHLVPQIKRQPDHPLQSLQQPKPDDNRVRFNSQGDDLQVGNEEDTLTDFQKWRINQEKVINKRTNKYNNDQKSSNITDETKIIIDGRTK